MKKSLKFLCLCLLAITAVLFCAPEVAFAGPTQITSPLPTLPESPFGVGTTVERLVTWATALYSALVVAITYVQAAFFPKMGAIPKVAVRAVVVAVVLAALFMTLGAATASQLAFGFVLSFMIYDKALKPLGIETPKPI
jgi:hypothetical protein